MKFKPMSRGKTILIIVLWLLPLLISVSLLVYLKLSWQIEIAPGEKLSPIDNKPVFVGLIIFTLGYLFFLGMLFSENIFELLNRRRSIIKR